MNGIQLLRIEQGRTDVSSLYCVGHTHPHVGCPVVLSTLKKQNKACALGVLGKTEEVPMNGHLM